MKTTDKIIHELKTTGPMTTRAIADELGLTTMGARQHLHQLQEQGYLTFEDKKAIRGRPARYWALTPESNVHFVDAHDQLTVQLIDSVKTVFGQQGLDKLIEHREQQSLQLYRSVLDQFDCIEAKLQALAELRSKEGYMASVIVDNNHFWLVENHCSICAAASQCLQFCQSELQQFQSLLQAVATVSREEHLLAGGRRCAYKVVPLG